MNDLFASSSAFEPPPPSPQDGNKEGLPALVRALGAPLCAGTPPSYAELAGFAMNTLGIVLTLLESQPEVTLEPAALEAWNPVDLADPAVKAVRMALLAHDVEALAFLKGVTGPELQALMEGLAAAPATLASIGGLRGHLEQRYIQTLEIRSTAPIAAHLPVQLVQEARAALKKTLATPDIHSWGNTGWLHYIGDLRHFGTLAFHLGIGASLPSEATLDLLRFTLQELSPDQFISLCRGLGSLPRQPKGLSLAFQHLVPQMLPAAVDKLVLRGLHWLVLHHPLEDLVAAFPGPIGNLLDPLREGVARIEGDGASLAQTFLEDLAWQAQNLNQQLDQIQTAEEFLALPVDSRVQLLDRTLKAHRVDALTDLIGHLGEVVASGSPQAQLATIRTIRAFLPSASQRTVPDYVVDCLEEIQVTAFTTEMDQDATKILREAILDTFRIRLVRNQPDRLVRVLRLLEGTEETRLDKHILSVPLSWAKQTLESEPFLDLSLECLFQGERQDSLTTCMIYYSYLGDALYRRVAWRLGRESDRSKRDRMVRVLITAGTHVEEALHCQLRPAMPWYHARNLLFVLSHIGTARSLPRLPSFLDHEDGRVRIVALRALRRCSQGKINLGHLVSRLEDPEEPIRQEASQILGTLRTRDALTALASLATDRKVPVASRRAAIDGLGKTRLAEASEVLLPLAECRGGLLKRAEPDEVRLAAARALVQIPGGIALLKHVIQQEGKGPLVGAMSQFLKA